MSYTPLDEVYILYTNITSIPQNKLLNDSCLQYVYKRFFNYYLEPQKIKSLPIFITIVNDIKKLSLYNSKTDFTINDKIDFMYRVYKNFIQWSERYPDFLKLFNYLNDNIDIVHEKYKNIINSYLQAWDKARVLYFSIKNKLNDYDMMILKQYTKNNNNEKELNIEDILKIGLLVKYLPRFNSKDNTTLNNKTKDMVTLYHTVGNKVASKINSNISLYDKISVMVNNQIINGPIIVEWMCNCGYV